jgi:hypothetical protein
MKFLKNLKQVVVRVVVIKKMLKQFFLYALKMQEGVKWLKVSLKNYVPHGFKTLSA